MQLAFTLKQQVMFLALQQNFLFRLAIIFKLSRELSARLRSCLLALIGRWIMARYKR
jgi:hypothetical protein